jgi:hypothetical protein
MLAVVVVLEHLKELVLVQEEQVEVVLVVVLE